MVTNKPLMSDNVTILSSKKCIALADITYRCFPGQKVVGWGEEREFVGKWDWVGWE